MILVSGATGLVGSNLIKKLSAQGKKVRGICRNPTKVNNSDYPDEVQLLKGDILEPASLDETLADVDTVIHLVGILFEVGGRTFADVHFKGTENLLNAAKKANVKRFIHVSALGTRFDAASRYHQTKWQAEEAVRNSGLDYTIFRPSVIFGPEDKFANQFAEMVAKSPVAPILGDGTARMQPVWVNDVTQCLTHAIEEPTTIGQTYELGGPDILTFRQIIDEILLATGKQRLKVPIPFPILTMNAWIMERVLPSPPVTVDQLIMAQEDNICKADPPWQSFGITPKSFATGIREFL
ncbi:MAG: complex I NDUFA9 subunit family protein [Magnetococcales bacterium]|nr:complex I NDUFA9 subunit family protein [Magnetococcales bacterium]